MAKDIAGGVVVGESAICHVDSRAPRREIMRLTMFVCVWGGGSTIYGLKKKHGI